MRCFHKPLVFRRHVVSWNGSTILVEEVEVETCDEDGNDSRHLKE